MASDEGIRDLYGAQGIRAIGTPYVFPKSRTVKTERRSKEEKERSRKANKKQPGRPPGKGPGGVDITV
ncbi:MAG: hypothetical protein AB1553_08230 [Nitrospirota bacterium]